MSDGWPAVAQTPWVRIKVENRLDGHLLQFSRPRTGKTLPIHVPAGKLAAARSEMTEVLRLLVDEVRQKLEWTPAEAGPILKRFYRRTYNLGAGAMKNGYLDMIEIHDFLENPQGLCKGGIRQARIVEVEGEDLDFPFELLPVLDNTPIEQPVDKDDMLRLARRFLGFSCAVRRLGRSSVAPGWNLEGPKLPVSFIRHASLDGEHLENDFFEEMRKSGCMEVDGPWPIEDLDDEALIKKVADVMFDGRRRLIANESGRFTQIHHFACHCQIQAQDGSGETVEDALILSMSEDDETFDRHLPLYVIPSEYADRERELRAGTEEPLPEGRGLVFLNACGSAFIDPARLTSFPQTFLSAKHRGVIGAATAVPDDLAAQFSTTFYRLLLAGASLGTALVQSRCWIVHKFGNPLGALYVLYADPDVRLNPHLALSRFQHPSFEI